MLALKKKAKRMMRRMMMKKTMGMMVVIITMKMMKKTMMMSNLKQTKIIDRIIEIIILLKRQVNHLIIVAILIIITLRCLTTKRVCKKNPWNPNHLAVSSKQKNNHLHSICSNSNPNKGRCNRSLKQIRQISISRRKRFCKVNKL